MSEISEDLIKKVGVDPAIMLAEVVVAITLLDLRQDKIEVQLRDVASSATKGERAWSMHQPMG